MDLDIYYEFVSDLITKKKFIEKIEEYSIKLGGLLDEDTIALLILDELGRNPANRRKVEDLYDGINATIEVNILKIIGEKNVLKNGKRKKRMDILVGDDTGKCYLTLWDSDVDRIGRKLTEGKKIKIINGFVWEDSFGIWITPGKWGTVILL